MNLQALTAEHTLVRKSLCNNLIRKRKKESESSAIDLTKKVAKRMIIDSATFQVLPLKCPAACATFAFQVQIQDNPQTIAVFDFYFVIFNETLLSISMGALINRTTAAIRIIRETDRNYQHKWWCHQQYNTPQAVKLLKMFGPLEKKNPRSQKVGLPTHLLWSQTLITVKNKALKRKSLFGN